MTMKDATERAKKIWGPTAKVVAAWPWQSQPGMTQWWIDLGTDTHALDVNGWVVCHSECVKLEHKVGRDASSPTP